MFNHNRFTRASPAQLDCLSQMGVEYDNGISSAEADRLIKQNKDKWEKLPATAKQRSMLQKGLWKEGMTRGEATKLIEKLTARDDDWPRPSWSLF